MVYLKRREETMNERRIEVSVRADSTYDLKGVLAEIEHRHKYEMMKKAPTKRNTYPGPKLKTFAVFRKQKR